MGLYFNTAATRQMQDKINEQFTGTNIDFWKNFARRKLFKKKNDSDPGLPLHAIAAQAQLVPDDANAKGRWKQWLSDLESETGDQLRDIFFDNLAPTGNCAELIFLPVLRQSMPIAIVPDPPVYHGNKYSLTVHIYTPTAKAVRAAIKKRRAEIAKRRAAKKKKA